MALIFNPPPNWPAPPSRDWRPVPGWQPDPAWGPAPEGWNFWVEDTPEVSEVSGHADATPAPAKSSTQNQQYAQNQPYTQGGTPGQQANPYSQTAVVTAASGGKKNFFTTGAGIVTIIGALLVVLIIALVSTLVIGVGSRDTSSGSDSYYSSVEESIAADILDDYGTAYGSDVQVADEEGSRVYTGSGNQIFSLDKPEGPESIAWLEYDFRGEDEYSSISFRTLDAHDSLTGSIIDSAFEQNSTGSYWLDARTIYDDKYTEKLKVEADGDWTITVHPLSKAPVKKVGDSISGNAAAAFLYESDDPSSVRATFTASDEYGGDVQVKTQGEDLETGTTTLINSNQDSFEGSASVPEGRQYMSVSTYSGSWELTFEGK